MSKPKSPITYGQLKEFVNSLNEEQLTQEVYLLGEEVSYRVQAAEELGEEMYIDDEGMNPLSVFEPYDEEDKLENYQRVPANMPFLYTDLDE